MKRPKLERIMLLDGGKHSRSYSGALKAELAASRAARTRDPAKWQEKIRHASWRVFMSRDLCIESERGHEFVTSNRAFHGEIERNFKAGRSKRFIQRTGHRFASTPSRR